jgi:predicted transcriptional regulator YdeE
LRTLDVMEIKEFKLAGLKTKTTNENGQSSIDCGKLWQKFSEEKYADKIPDKLGNDIFAVYYNYEGDHTKPFSYFIGCQVKSTGNVPEEFDSLIIPDGRYQVLTAKGKIPDCIVNTWNNIWESGIDRAFKFDFEVYSEKSRDWNNAEVEIMVSVK